MDADSDGTITCDEMYSYLYTLSLVWEANESKQSGGSILEGHSSSDATHAAAASHASTIQFVLLHPGARCFATISVPRSKGKAAQEKGSEEGGDVSTMLRERAPAATRPRDAEHSLQRQKHCVPLVAEIKAWWNSAEPVLHNDKAAQPLQHTCNNNHKPRKPLCAPTSIITCLSGPQALVLPASPLQTHPPPYSQSHTH